MTEEEKRREDYCRTLSPEDLEVKSHDSNTEWRKAAFKVIQERRTKTEIKKEEHNREDRQTTKKILCWTIIGVIAVIAGVLVAIFK